MIKTLSMSAAAAALMVSGALAQTAQPADPAAPANPPAAQQAAPSQQPAPSATTSTTTTTTTQTGSVNFSSAMGQNEMLASEISGMEVRNSAGEDLGDINDLVMDKSGKPVVAIIGVGGFLGIGEKDVGVPFDALTFADASDGKSVVRLDVTKDALKNAPNYVYKDRTTATNATGRDVNATGSTGAPSTNPAAPKSQ